MGKRVVVFHDGIWRILAAKHDLDLPSRSCLDCMKTSYIDLGVIPFQERRTGRNPHLALCILVKLGLQLPPDAETTLVLRPFAIKESTQVRR
jgi:hypothetical protein